MADDIDAVSKEAASEEEVDEETFLDALGSAVGALERARVPYMVIGGLASAVYGRPRWTHDIDLFVKPEDARRALHALADADFVTEETNPHWIYKAWRDGAVVDLIFCVKGDIYVDDEMLARSRVAEFKGRSARVLPPEDLVVIKAVVHDEPSARHWHDALGIIAATELDWDYLLRRARHGARRVLSLLVYAQSNDLVVPELAIQELSETIYPS
jgi:predicted nucleotidyltransferase